MNSNCVIWSNAMSLSLLEEFRKRDVLWDPKNQYFFNMMVKENTWDDLSRAMGLSKVECKRKMESLKGSFRRERSRLNKAKNGIGGPFTPKWFAFEAMKFLDEREDPRSCYSNPPPELFGEIRLVGDKPQFVQYSYQDINEKDPHWDKPEKSEEDLCDDDDTPIDCKPFPVVMVDVDDPLTDPDEPFTKKRAYSNIEDIPETVVVPSSPSDDGISTPVGIQETTLVTNSHSPRHEEKSECSCRDECSTYGQHVANKLRKLDDRSRALVQHKINILLFKAEMKMFGGDENI